jgi:hypothetical protein
MPSAELAYRLGDPLNPTPHARRIVGVVADVDDEHMVRQPAITMYAPASPLLGYGGRLFVRTASDPYSIMPAVTRVLGGVAGSVA